MKFIVSVLLVAFSFSAFAQIDPQKMQYLKKSERYRKMRNIGLAMAVVGAGMGITGMVKMMKTSTYNSTTGQYTITDDNAALMWMAGAPLFGAGLPIGLIGLKKNQQYERKLMDLKIGFQFSPRQQGLTLTYKF